MGEHNNNDSPKTFLDNFIQILGRATAWLNLVLIAIIILQVFLRYALEGGFVALEELQWHLYGIGIVLGLSYAVSVDSHIRLDVLHHKFSPKTKAVVDILGVLLLLMPFAVIGLIEGFDFFQSSFNIGEESDAPMGLPYRWLIKAFLPASFFMLILSGISRLLSQIMVFTKSAKEN